MIYSRENHLRGLCQATFCRDELTTKPYSTLMDAVVLTAADVPNEYCRVDYGKIETVFCTAQRLNCADCDKQQTAEMSLMVELD